MTGSTEDLRAWAKKCADVTRGRMPEYVAWDLIAERGEEWEVARRPDGKPYRGGPLMTPKMCFTNAARIAGGLTSFNPEGYRYAEGWMLGPFGIWFHHGWVVTAAGLVIERTLKEPGDRYVGVTFDEFPRDPGLCQLADWPFGHAWGPNLVQQPAEAVDRLFSGRVNQ
jgi:hypothetical protein